MFLLLRVIHMYKTLQAQATPHHVEWAKVAPHRCFVHSWYAGSPRYHPVGHVMFRLGLLQQSGALSEQTLGLHGREFLLPATGSRPPSFVSTTGHSAPDCPNLWRFLLGFPALLCDEGQNCRRALLARHGPGHDVQLLSTQVGRHGHARPPCAHGTRALRVVLAELAARQAPLEQLRRTCQT